MIRLDPDRRRVYGPRGQTELTKVEYRLLQRFVVEGFNRPISNDALLEYTWPYLKPGLAKASFWERIYRIRLALLYVGGARIVCIRTIGYKIEAIPTPVAFARAA